VLTRQLSRAPQVFSVVDTHASSALHQRFHHERSDRLTMLLQHHRQLLQGLVEAARRALQMVNGHAYVAKWRAKQGHAAQRRDPERLAVERAIEGQERRLFGFAVLPPILDG
jgi:hypothetical protein